MGAKYVSDKPDGYMRTRNNIYLEREALQQTRTYKEAGASRNLPPQSKANYGKKDISGVIFK
jgi:threonine dehydratase